MLKLPLFLTPKIANNYFSTINHWQNSLEKRFYFRCCTAFASGPTEDSFLYRYHPEIKLAIFESKSKGLEHVKILERFKCINSCIEGSLFKLGSRT